MASSKNCAESAQIVCDLCAKSRKTSKLAQFHGNLEETISPCTNQDSLHPFIYGNISHFLVNSGSKQTSSIKEIAESASFLTKRGGCLGNDEGKKKEQIFLGIQLHTEEQQKFKTGLADNDKKKTNSNGSFPEIYTVNKLGILVHSVQGKGLWGEVR